jgi:multidrug resistance efflux pump
MEQNEEKVEVINALRKFKDQFDNISTLIAEKKTMTQDEKEHARYLLKTLKADLEASAKYGTVSGKKTEMNDYERKYFEPAVFKAKNKLNARINTDPIKGKWLDNLWYVESEISIWLHKLEEHNE